MGNLLADLKLHRITCLKQSEKDGDELYILFKATRVAADAIASERVPSEMGFWRMHTGDVVTPDHLLYIDEIGAGLQLTVRVMEMDMLRMFKNSLSIVGQWIDDYVGQVTLELSPTQKPITHLGKHTVRETHSENPDDGIHAFRLVGNKSEYLLELHLVIGGKDVG
ncbi:MAG: hypothetical protein SFY70_09665 [Bacteroidia bacterium]|nr:hypothetical protein [Bacteroidia bacterium]